MYDIEKNQLAEIRDRLTHLFAGLDLDSKEKRLAELSELTSAQDLWSDPEKARTLLQEQDSLKRVTTEARSLEKLMVETEEFLQLADAEKDESLADDLKAELAKLQSGYDEFEFHQTLNGETDHNNAYLTIHSGAGGTEACDWCAMLKRMYERWAERHGFKCKIQDFLDGEEAGFKSVTLHIAGEYAYGYLKSEIGVHRLVRISPFDANQRRQTSFASIDVTPEVDDDIDIVIDEKDLRIDTYRSSGAGGQHVNKTESAIRITHIPSGIVVSCQNERSQFKNKAEAMKMLKAKLYQLEMNERLSKQNTAYANKQKIEWGSQIRSYVLHPYNMVKDLRTDVETSNTGAVLDGEIDLFIEAYLRATATLS